VPNITNTGPCLTRLQLPKLGTFFQKHCVCACLSRGAVALDGRIEPGDMILEVNGVSFENLSNDEAVRVLRDVVQKSGSADFHSFYSQLSVYTVYRKKFNICNIISAHLVTSL